MKRITLLILMSFLWSWSSFAQVSIGEQDGTTSFMPIYSCYNYSYSQQIVYQNEINSAGDITSISFFFQESTSPNNSSSSDWTVYMGHTAKTSFADTSDWVAIGDLTEVYTGTVTYPENGNQMLITFDTPFTYNNAENLVFAVDENQPNFDCSNYFGKTGDLGAQRAIFARHDTNNPDPANPPQAWSTESFINNVILGGIEPSCSTPIDLAVNNITLTEADLSWTAGGSETEWEVIYGETGFDPATEGTTLEVNDDAEVTLSDLDANTEYEFYVKSICGAGDESTWAGPVSFTTSCEAGEVPFVEGFEAYAGGENLAGCWSQVSVEGTQAWFVNDEEDTYNRTPRNGDRNVYIRWSNEDWMFYPLELTEDTEYELKFFARQDATSGASVEAAYGISNDPDEMINSIIAESDVVDGDYQEFSGTFTPSTSGVYYIGIKGTTDFTPFYLSLDDISVMDTSVAVCEAPTDLAVANITNDSADLSWTAGGSETEWEVLYGEAGFDPASEGTTVEVDTDPETTLVGLDDDTQYEFYVRAICDTNDESAWTGPVAFSTLVLVCDPTTVPYTLDFEEVTIPALPECTAVQNVGDGNNWDTASPNEFGFNTKVLRYKYSTTDPGNTWFYTQGIELEAGVEYHISYKYGNNSEFLFVESMKVAYGTSPDVSAMNNELADYPSITGGEPNFEELTFTVVDDGVYYFGFNAYSATNRFHLYLDDIMIDVADGDCDPATDVAVSDISQNSATVSWTASTTATDGYEVEVYLDGEDPTTATPQVSETVGVGVTTVDVIGLLADTSYDLYVISDCGDDNFAVSDVVSFTTIELGVSGNDLTKISYFPNPMKDQLTITAAGKVETVTVTNLLGQTVIQVQPRSNNVVLDMSALPVGTYILKTSVDSAISTFKVIKE